MEYKCCIKHDGGNTYFLVTATTESIALVIAKEKVKTLLPSLTPYINTLSVKPFKRKKL